MRTIFADAGYWIALLSPRDQHHARATVAAAELGEAKVVTTQMVLAETYNGLAKSGVEGRRYVSEMLSGLESDPDIEIVPQTDAQFRAAAERYSDRLDQDWGLTDCASFLLMEERGITEALAHDRDFEQAGFTALLRENS